MWDYTGSGVGHTLLVYMLHSGVGEDGFVTTELRDDTGGGIGGLLIVRSCGHRYSGEKICLWQIFFAVGLSWRIAGEGKDVCVNDDGVACCSGRWTTYMVIRNSMVMLKAAMLNT